MFCPAANKSEPTSTTCIQHITTQNQNQASNSKPPSHTIHSKQQPTKYHPNKQHTQRSTTNTNFGNQQARNKQLKTLKINVNGIQNKTAELQQLLTQENIGILTIQETKLNSTNKT